MRIDESGMKGKGITNKGASIPKALRGESINTDNPNTNIRCGEDVEGGRANWM